MSVTNDEVRRIAALARLSPDDRTVDRLTGEMNGVLEHIRILESLDVDEATERGQFAKPAIEPHDPSLGPSVLAEGAPGDRAPDWRNGFFVVPRLPALDGGDSAGAGE